MNAIAMTNLQVGALGVLTQIAQIICKVSAAVLLCCCVLLVPYYIKTLLLAKKDVDEKNAAAYDGWVSRYNLAHQEFNDHQAHLEEVEELADQGYIIQSKISNTEANKGKVFAFPTSLPDSQYPDDDRIHDSYGMEVVGEDDLVQAYPGRAESEMVSLRLQKIEDEEVSFLSQVDRLYFEEGKISDRAYDELQQGNVSDATFQELDDLQMREGAFSSQRFSAFEDGINQGSFIDQPDSFGSLGDAEEEQRREFERYNDIRWFYEDQERENV